MASKGGLGLGILGNSGKSGYQSTVKMQFRGQDKEHKPALGDNPNQNFEDEYILNLQQ